MLKWGGTRAELLFRLKVGVKGGRECHGLVFTVLVPQECLPAGSGSGKKKKIQKQMLNLFLKKCILNYCRASSFCFCFNVTFGTGV